MPNIRFNISVYIENEAFLPELQSRLDDLSPAFNAMFREWTQLNMQKFEQSVGREVSGADIFEEFWAGLTPGYMKEKHKIGATRVTKKMVRGKSSFGGAFPDWLMVRTGALRDAMTNPDLLFNDIEPQSASFGTPNDPELADIIHWQASPRQKNRYVIFLSGPDVKMIKRILQDYLGMGGDFEQMRSSKALSMIGQKKEISELDAGFDYAVGGE